MPKYCIKNTETMDIIANNLTEDEAYELFDFYEDFCGTGSVFISEIPATIEQEYKYEFIELFAELQEMGNLI